MFDFGFKPGQRYTKKLCRICHTEYPMKERQCPSCGTVDYCELI